MTCNNGKAVAQVASLGIIGNDHFELHRMVNPYFIWPNGLQVTEKDRLILVLDKIY